jgi:hypothetical protein
MKKRKNVLKMVKIVNKIMKMRKSDSNTKYIKNWNNLSKENDKKINLKINQKEISTYEIYDLERMKEMKLQEYMKSAKEVLYSFENQLQLEI